VKRRRLPRLQDPVFAGLTVDFYNAVLSMRMRRWLQEPDLEGGDPGFRLPPGDDDDGLSGSRIPRRPILDPGAASAALTFDESDDQPDEFDFVVPVEESAHYGQV
jgi:hypothetical protein